MPKVSFIFNHNFGKTIFGYFFSKFFNFYLMRLNNLALHLFPHNSWYHNYNSFVNIKLINESYDIFIGSTEIKR